MTASHFTPRLALPYPDQADPADVPLDIYNLAIKLDELTARAPKAVTSAAAVLDVGVLNQVRAGRQLTVADFTALGLAAPAGLWNLSDLTDASGNGRALTNKGAVVFAPGINGTAATAASFAGSTAQALYIADTGAADPFRIRTGTIGCWFRTAKRAVAQELLTKASSAAGQYCWFLAVSPGNQLNLQISTTGADAPNFTAITEVADDRWHWAVATWDGSTARVYLDTVLETVGSIGIAAPGSGPLNIGGYGADATTTASGPHYGRVDEAFVTADVLSPEQIRGLYCAKLAHGASYTPSAVTLGVRRRKKGGPLVVADFPTQPLRLHNFTAGSLGDEGSGNVALVNNGAAVSVAGADGALGGAFNFVQSVSQSLSSTDAGLPAATATRSYGCWLKCTGIFTGNLLAWGTVSTADARLVVVNGQLLAYSGTDSMGGAYVNDGAWRQCVVVENNEAGDGLKRKFYMDGVLSGASTVLTPITLGGANHFRVGANPSGEGFWNGEIDGAFVCGYALTQEQVSTLYAKGSQALGPSVKSPGAHIELIDATNVYATFDTLESQNTIDLAVTG